MSLKSVVTAGAIALLAVSSTYAGRIETRLDGTDWTLDGLPVLVPNCWNKIDAADGDPGDGNKRKSGCKSVPATTYERRRGVYSRALPGASAGRRYFVRCEGASQKATVRVNGTTLGVHKGSFTAFCFEATAGYKGYGFGMVCEIMTAILSGGTTSEKVYRTPSGSGIAHFFMAIDPALFGDAREQSRRLSAFMAALRESSRADGAERIYVHGEKEEIARREVIERGVPVQAKTWEEMCEIASLTGTGDYLPSFALLSCCL